jgi:hypothetical protein
MDAMFTAFWSCCAKLDAKRLLPVKLPADVPEVPEVLISQPSNLNLRNDESRPGPRLKMPAAFLYAS